MMYYIEMQVDVFSNQGLKTRVTYSLQITILIGNVPALDSGMPYGKGRNF
jgi:hypothetical protein